MSDMIQVSAGRQPNADPQEAPKLTDWRKEPSVMDLKAELDIAKPARDAHMANVERWINMRDTKGPYKPKASKTRSTVQPKLVRRQNEWRYAPLSEPFLSSERTFTVNPRTFEDRNAARQNMLLLNYQFDQKINKVSFVDEVVRTFVDEGTVVFELGWIRETKIETRTVPVYEYFDLTEQDVEAAQILEQGLVMRHQNYNEYLRQPEDLRAAVEFTLENERPVYAQEAGTQEVEEEIIVENKPTIETIQYGNVYLDPAAEGDVDKATFAIVSFETSKAELLKDGRYKNLDKVIWSQQTPTTEHEHQSSGNVHDPIGFKDDLRKRVVAYRYYGWANINGDEETLTPILATWIGSTMIRMEENPFPDQKIPLVIAKYLPVKKQTHGEPDAELLEENQAIQGALIRGMIDLLGRSANGQTGFAKGSLDAVNRRRYDNGLDYEFNPGSDIRSMVFQHSYPEIPRSALTMLSLQNQEAESLTGVKAFSGGLSGEAYGDVAAGIRGMLDAASKREMGILRRLAEAFRKIGKKIIAMNAEFLSEVETIRITNEEYVDIHRDELGGEFDLIVDISTAEVEDAQAQDLAFMLQTMGNNMDFNMVKIILSKIARLKRMPDLAKMVEEFEPQPSPLEQVEIQKAQLEVQKLQKEIEEIDADIALKYAKAREAQSGADLKDLDFVEQESGTKHARDVDKIRSQSEGNQETKITEAILNQGGEGGPTTQNIRQAVAYDRIMNQLRDRRTGE